MAALDLVTQSVSQFRNLPPARQAALALAALGSLAFCLWIAIGAGRGRIVRQLLTAMIFITTDAG